MIGAVVPAPTPDESNPVLASIPCVLRVHHRINGVDLGGHLRYPEEREWLVRWLSSALADGVDLAPLAMSPSEPPCYPPQR